MDRTVTPKGVCRCMSVYVLTHYLYVRSVENRKRPIGADIHLYAPTYTTDDGR